MYRHLSQILTQLCPAASYSGCCDEQSSFSLLVWATASECACLVDFMSHDSSHVLGGCRVRESCAERVHENYVERVRASYTSYDSFQCRLAMISCEACTIMWRSPILRVEQHDSTVCTSLSHFEACSSKRTPSTAEVQTQH